MSKSTNTTNYEMTTRKMTSYLRSLANRRNSGQVTADDAHTYLNRNGISTQSRTRLSFINSVLRSPMFETTGNTKPSNRPVAKGRAISVWYAK